MPQPPKYFWLLPLVLVVAWWPLSPYWQSDDFVALHYAADWRNVVRDFVGPQYGSTDVWLFYRPLITLSFWLDQCVAGTEPFWSHLSNVLAHALSAWLGARLLLRFVPPASAFAAAMWWGLLPSHVAAIAWAVGRVDSHTTVWCLAALLAALARADRLRQGAALCVGPMLVLAACAMLSKESSFALPWLAAALVWCSQASNPQRWHITWRATWPMFALLLLVLAWRYLVLGRLGGYLAAELAWQNLLLGLCSLTLDALCPWRWGIDLPAAAKAILTMVTMVVVGATLRKRMLGASLCLFGLAAAPSCMFFADAANVHNLRYLYLPLLAIAGLLAARGPLVPWLLTASLLWPAFAVRVAQLSADRQTQAQHQNMLAIANRQPALPLFLSGLPHHATTAGRAVQLHFGVDRLLAPPWRNTAMPLVALRPLAMSATAFSLPANHEFGLPSGSVWHWSGETSRFQPVIATRALPKLQIAGDEAGRVDFAATRLMALTLDAQASFQLTTSPGRPEGFRITLFTAGGYLACLCFDHGVAGATVGTIDARKLLAGDPATGLEPARYGLDPAAFLGEALDVPTTIDLDPCFPVWIEAGQMRDGAFVPTHQADRLLLFCFDRGYAQWKRLVQGRS